jgi:hypothetical protein
MAARRLAAVVGLALVLTGAAGPVWGGARCYHFVDPQRPCPRQKEASVPRQLSVRDLGGKALEAARAARATFLRHESFYAVVPLLILLFDFLQAPLFWEHRYLAENLRIDDLLYHSAVDLGTVHGHRLHVLIGAFDDLRFLDHVRRGRSALVISLYRGLTWGQVGAGTSARGVLDLLARHSPTDHDRFLRQIAETRGYAPGSVLAYSLDRPVSLGGPARIEDVLAVRIDIGERGTPYALQQGMAEVFRRAESSSIRSLVIPCLGISWKHDTAPSFDEYFSTLFQALQSTQEPQDLYVFFYRDWPTFVLESAVSSFNSRWSSQQAVQQGLGSRIHRLDFRLALLAAPLYMLAGSVKKRLDWKRAIVLFFSFLGIVLAFYAGLERLLPVVQSSVTFDLFKTVTTLAGAVVIPWLIEP